MENRRHIAALLLSLIAVYIFWASFIRPSVVLSEWKVSNDGKSYVDTYMPHYSYHTVVPYIYFKGDLVVPEGLENHVLAMSVDGCFMEVVVNGGVVYSNPSCTAAISHDERDLQLGPYLKAGSNQVGVRILFDGGTTRFDVFEARSFNLVRFFMVVLLLAAALLLLKSNPRHVLFLLLMALAYVHLFSSSFSVRWGYNALESFPRITDFMLTVAAVVISLPYSYDMLKSFAVKLLAKMQRKIKRFRHKIRLNVDVTTLKENVKFVTRYLSYGLVSLASFMLFWFFRTRNSMGDHGFVGRIALDKTHLFFHTSPLAAWSLSLAYRLLNSIGFSYSSYDASAMLACFAGALSVPAIWVICREVLDDTGKRLMLFSIITSAYFMQLFFGYIEFYPLLLAAMVYYTLAGVYYLKDKAGIVWPSIAFAVMFSIHLSSGYLGPSLLLLYLYKVYERKEALMRGFFSMSLPVIVIVFLFFSHVILVDMSCDSGFLTCVKNYVEGLKGSDPSFFRPDTFTMTFAQELLTELIYITPGAVIIILLLLAYYLKRTPLKDPFFLFAALSTAGFFLYTATHSTGTGLPNDWDVLAPVGFPMTMLVGYWMAKSVDDRKLLTYCAVSVVSVVLLVHTIPTLLDSADKEYVLYNPSRTVSEAVDYMKGVPASVKSTVIPDADMLKLVDALDVGNAASERDHSYTINEQSANGTAMTSYPNGTVVEDDYRSYRDYESFIVKSVPKKELLIVKRVKCPSSQVTRAYLHGYYLGVMDANCVNSEETWKDLKIEAPATLIEGDRVGLMFVSDKKEDIESYRYWFYAKS